MSPVVAATETFHEGGPTHPASASHTCGKAPSEKRDRVDSAEGGQWPMSFSLACCLLWRAPLSEIDMVQQQCTLCATG